MSAFETWFASDVAKTLTDPEGIARQAWDAALCAAGSACLHPQGEESKPVKHAYEIQSALTRLHSWYQPSGEPHSESADHDGKAAAE